MGQGLALGFAHQQMHVLGHQHVPVNGDAELSTHVLQTGEEQGVRDGKLETRLTMITTESEKMRLTRVMISPQSAGHPENVDPEGYGVCDARVSPTEGRTRGTQ